MKRAAASIFVDSGAFSLYMKVKDKSYFTLKEGSKFRRYCDRYAAFMKAMKGRVLLANVDLIFDPDKTWEVQRYFEEEHGLTPIPVVHFRTPMTYIDRYIDATIKVNGKSQRKYDLIGVGGFAFGGTGRISWLDNFFIHICPKENDFKPVIRVHGFALTGWFSICRWPWWSVDSTTWFTTASFGGIYMPRWNNKTEEWRYDRAPMVVQISDRSEMKSHRGKHHMSLAAAEKDLVEKWLNSIGKTLQEVSGEGNKTGRGEDPSYIARSFVNLTYFKNLEESRPEYPHALDDRIIRQAGVIKYHQGFGL